MYTQVIEFSKEIQLDHLKHGPSGILVMYKWEWCNQVDSEQDRSSDTTWSMRSTFSHTPDSSPLPVIDDATVTVVPTITHSVVFKCIGAVRDEEQQRALQEAFIARQSGENVPVKIEPEPTNPHDSQAISFTCKVGQSWHRIGYVVRECLDELHAAIHNGDILQVQFSWVKYLLQWSRSGPGFYAGIIIIRKGQWSDTCVRSASTR